MPNCCCLSSLFRCKHASFVHPSAFPVAGLQLNVVHYTTLMSCLQKAGQVRWPQLASRISCCRSAEPAAADGFLCAWTAPGSGSHTYDSLHVASPRLTASLCWGPCLPQWERSMEVFKRMERSGIQPDVVAHNAAIAACAKVRCTCGAWQPTRACSQRWALACWSVPGVGGMPAERAWTCHQQRNAMPPAAPLPGCRAATGRRPGRSSSP